jgi:hypothetical protein
MGVNYGSLLWSAVSLTSLTTKKVNFTIENLYEYKAICNLWVRGPYMELFDGKKPEVENLVRSL